jgi:hypothetical protein
MSAIISWWSTIQNKSIYTLLTLAFALGGFYFSINSSLGKNVEHDKQSDERQDNMRVDIEQLKITPIKIESEIKALNDKYEDDKDQREKDRMEFKEQMQQFNLKLDRYNQNMLELYKSKR